MNNKDLIYDRKTKTIRDVSSEINLSTGAISKNKDYTPKHKVENAIIFAAGKGSRLMPLTSTVPKPMVQVDGVSIVETTIKSLKELNINDITVIVNTKTRH